MGVLQSTTLGDDLGVDQLADCFLKHDQLADCFLKHDQLAY
jgi:hypothetical protein